MKLEVPGRVENWAFPPCWKKDMKKRKRHQMLTQGRCGFILTFEFFPSFLIFQRLNLVLTIFKFLHSAARHESSNLHQIHECQVVLVDCENASDIVSFYQLPSMCSSLRLSFSRRTMKQTWVDQWQLKMWCFWNRVSKWLGNIGQVVSMQEYGIYTLYIFIHITFSYRF